MPDLFSEWRDCIDAGVISGRLGTPEGVCSVVVLGVSDLFTPRLRKVVYCLVFGDWVDVNGQQWLTGHQVARGR